jgi:hypothetical protein
MLSVNHRDRKSRLYYNMIRWADTNSSSTSTSTTTRETITSLSNLFKIHSSFSALSESYIELATTHYLSFANTILIPEQISATAYVALVLNKVSEERERARICFSTDVAEKVVEIVRFEAGERQSEKVVRRG